MKRNQSLMFGFVLGLMLIGLYSNVTMAGPCPSGHCSKFSKDLNVKCIKNGLAGKQIYYPIGDDFCYCNCSCYATDSAVSTTRGEIPVQSISRAEHFTNPAGDVPVQATLYSPVKNAKAIQLSLDNGQSMLLSPNHALVNSDGIVVEAVSLDQGDRLMGESGNVVNVLEKKTVSYTGTFYNFILKGNNDSGVDRIVLSSGVQNGDWKVQSYRDYLNANVELRKIVSNIKKDESK